MQTPVDLFARHQQEMAEQAAAAERGRKQNVELFTKMWLSLGADCIKATGSSHRPEIDEALGLASHRWNQLLAMEQQVVREEAALATRPKKRPAQPGDEVLPDRTLAQRDAAWVDETKYKQDSLAALKEQAKRERKELESFRR
jgi:hypothetical protein